MAVHLTDDERRVLEAFVANEKKDANGAWNSFHDSILAAVADGGEVTDWTIGIADATCRNLRRRKLLKGEGQGQRASYYLTDKGKEAVG